MFVITWTTRGACTGLGNEHVNEFLNNIDEALNRLQQCDNALNKQKKRAGTRVQKSTTTLIRGPHPKSTSAHLLSRV